MPTYAVHFSWRRYYIIVKLKLGDILKKALLVAVEKDEEVASNSLDELNNLLQTIGIKEEARIIQKALKFNPKTYVGQGKLEELLIYVEEYNIDYVVNLLLLKFIIYMKPFHVLY